MKIEFENIEEFKEYIKTFNEVKNTDYFTDELAKNALKVLKRKRQSKMDIVPHEKETGKYSSENTRKYSEINSTKKYNLCCEICGASVKGFTDLTVLPISIDSNKKEENLVDSIDSINICSDCLTEITKLANLNF